MNDILQQGVVTPFVIFTFPTGFTIEDTVNSLSYNGRRGGPRYFMNLSHNRTCKVACTFTLTIVYVPDTFRAAEPYALDQILLASTGGKVVYSYGYYDRFGSRHIQQQVYVGQIFQYKSNVDVSSGTITYTVEGTASAADLSNSMARIDATSTQVKPSEHFKKLVADAQSGGFKDLRDTYAIYAPDNNDEAVYIPNFDSAPVLSLIMGTVTAEKNNGMPVRKGGLVQLSVGPEMSIREASDLGLISSDQEDLLRNQGSYTVNSAADALLMETKWKARKNTTRAVMRYPYICYIDDKQTIDGKLGTLKYVMNRRDADPSVDNYIYYMGNNQRNSDVLDFSVDYDAAVARAAVMATGKTMASIDPDGNGYGQTYSLTDAIATLGKNTFGSKNGMDQNLLISIQEMADIMLYPFEATMEIIGQTHPNELLDVIYVTIMLNGTKHETLSGEYKILEISDEISASGFTTTFRMIRQVDRITTAMEYMEYAKSTGSSGNVGAVQDAINSVVVDSTTSGTIQNRT